MEWNETSLRAAGYRPYPGLPFVYIKCERARTSVGPGRYVHLVFKRLLDSYTVSLIAVIVIAGIRSVLPRLTRAWPAGYTTDESERLFDSSIGFFMVTPQEQETGGEGAKLLTPS